MHTKTRPFLMSLAVAAIAMVGTLGMDLGSAHAALNDGRYAKSSEAKKKHSPALCRALLEIKEMNDAAMLEEQLAGKHEDAAKSGAASSDAERDAYRGGCAWAQ